MPSRVAKLIINFRLEIEEADLYIKNFEDKGQLYNGVIQSLPLWQEQERQYIRQELKIAMENVKAMKEVVQKQKQHLAELEILRASKKLYKSQMPPKPLVRGICDNSSCSAQSVHRCSRCLQAAFCSMQCHVENWPVHQGDCVPWRERQRRQQAERKAEVD